MLFDGLQADVVTLALAYDIDALHENGNLLGAEWQKKLPHNAAPYTSTIAFLVRKGNPKRIGDWPDLARACKRSTPTPRCSTRARAARPPPSSNEASAMCSSLGRTRRISRCRNWARTSSRSSPRAFNPRRAAVAVVERNVDRKGTRKMAQAYLEYLYSPEGQAIAAGKHYYRPRDPAVAAQFARRFAPVRVFTVDEVFGGWREAQKTHFDDGASFDQIYALTGR